MLETGVWIQAMTSKMKTLNIIVYSYNNVQYKTNKNVIN